MTPLYEIGVVATEADGRPAEFADAVQRLVADLGTQQFANVSVTAAADLGLDAPTVVVVFWTDGLWNEGIESVLGACAAKGVTVLPIVATSDHVPALPPALASLNAVGWDRGAQTIGRLCLREVGLHESSRGVFISHRRADGLIVAEQLFGAFSEAGWRPFVDRFGIDAGSDVQDRIDEALEESAFLLLLETPSASASPWVQHEVLYALERHLGIAIVRIAGAPEFPATGDLPRHDLCHPFTLNGSHIVLAQEAVNEVVELVERTHAIALARRRRQLLVSAMAAARSAGRSVEPAPGWRLRVSDGTGHELVGVLPHLPTPQDLYDIDLSNHSAERSVLVHAAHVIDARRRSILDWMIGDRMIELVPNNAIGARWISVVAPMTPPQREGSGGVVFVSASIPDPDRWSGVFDPFAITDAVVATARAVFTRGGQILTAAHPTVAPLILQVADAFPGEHQTTLVILYQSALFEKVIPAATRQMMNREYVNVVFTPAAAGDRPEPGHWGQSLGIMREAMMTEVPIAAAVFVGGMEGIVDEYERVGAVHPGAPRYALGRPGGEAASLANSSRLAPELAGNDLYPWLLNQVMDEVFGTART